MKILRGVSLSLTALSTSAVLLAWPVVGVSASRAERSLQNNNKNNDKNNNNNKNQVDEDKNEQQVAAANAGSKSWTTTKECNCWE